jgi:hypothetical protein
LTPNPIRKVLSTFRNCEVRALLMGGQACVLYGAAEFSRDTDFAILADAANLERLQHALTELQAGVIAVPPFRAEFLLRGHAVHFRCLHPEAAGMRVDVMATMRGVAPFDELWVRRATVVIEDGTMIEVLALEDLVAAKKTQRDKDWPMIRRLVEADYAAAPAAPSVDRVRFWLREARTPELLDELARRYPGEREALVAARPLLALAGGGDEDALELAIEAEERKERHADRDYWAPLKRELELLRRNRPRES